METAPAGATYDLAPVTAQTPLFVGYAPDDYVLVFVVEDPYGLSLLDFTIVHVADNIPPVAISTADKATTHVGETVCFDASQSSDLEGGLLSYTWDFQDGSMPLLDEISPCHVFWSLGSYGVFLRVVDERNAADVDVVEIKVLPPAAVPTLPRSGLTLLLLLLSVAGAGAISSGRDRAAS